MFSENEEVDCYNVKDRHLSTESLPLSTPLKTQVFLRIRPTSTPVENESYSNIYTVEDSSSLFVRQMSLSDTYRRIKFTKSNDNLSRKKFTFTKIFNLKTSQSQFFAEAIKPIVIDFLNNLSSTVLSYGTTDAGKTYTLFGSIYEPGVIPRAIEFIYSNLNCTETPLFKPTKSRSVVSVDKCDQILEIEATQKFLLNRLFDKSMYEETYEMLRDSELNKNIEIDKNSIYSIWISFIEIYNETIFDLLELDEEGKNMQLKLAIDKHGVTYIQGMRSICATTGLQAYQILNAGQMRLTTVSTSSYKSSRSHSVFIIKLLKYDKNSAPSEVEVSTISFGDLAGTGKIQKIVKNMKQFRESRSINTSLLALGKCLKVIAEGHSRQSIGSFRDSKLTRLFQHSFCGKEAIVLLINVNPTPELFTETQNVLKFASTAMKLTSEFTKEDKRFLDNNTPILSPKVQVIHSSRAKTSSYEREIDEIILKNKQLLAELRELKSMNLKKEYEVRQELANFYSKQLNDLEENWKSRMIAMEQEMKGLLEFSVMGVENYYKDKLVHCLEDKCKKIDRNEYEELSDASKLSNTENFELNSKNVSQENNFIKSDNNSSQLQNLELILLKNSLKTLVDSIKNPNEKSDNFINLKSLNIYNINKNTLFDKDIKSYLSIIIDFLQNSSEFDDYFEKCKRIETAAYTKEIQYHSEHIIFNKFCKEIQELLDPKLIKLPDIDDSLNVSECDQDENINQQLVTLLPRLKELIIQNLSKINKLETDNTEKLDEIKVLNKKMDQQDRDILQLKLQQHESESIRLTLIKQIEDLENKLKSKYFFKTIEYDNGNSNPHLSDMYCRHDISEQESSLESSLDDNFELCSYERKSKKNISGTERSSSNSSKNDSGVVSMDYTTKSVKDKICQINFFGEVDQNELNINYSCTKPQHLEEPLKLTELTQKLEETKEELARLKENHFAKELIIIEYETKVNSKDTEIVRLKNEKEELSIKYNTLMKNLEEVNKEQEKKIHEYQVKVKLYKETQNKTAKTLEDYWEKSVKLGSQLSFSCSQLEKMSITCNEYMDKINELEKQLDIKKFNENEITEKLIQFEKDHLFMNDILEKVNKFENTLNLMERKKSDLQQTMLEKSKSLLEVEEQTANLDTKFEECDKQVLSLKSELSIIIRTNLSNRRKVTELGGEVAKLMEKIRKMEEDLVKSETARKDLEQSSSTEISNLRSRLIIFEENAKLLNMICDTNDNKSNNIEKLQAKLVEKEKELEYFKKNRNTTIRRYESLVRHLQGALKMNSKSIKMNKLCFSKQNNFLNKSKEIFSHDDVEPTSKFHDDSWKLFDNEHACSLTNCNPKNKTYLSSDEYEEKIMGKGETDYLVLDTDDESLKTDRRKISENHRSKYSEHLCTISDSENSYESDHFTDRLINR